MSTVANQGEAECGCDFCTGKKKLADNWCPGCAEVILQPPRHWENLDVCDACEAEILKEKTR